MQLGFSSMNTPEEPAPGVLAPALEERGYDSLWIGEHTHIPTSRETPYPAGGDLPGPYLRTMDPYLALMLAAGATTSLLIGTGVSLPLEHDVLALGKAVATLDRLSGGRLLFGVGVGWNREELANHTDIPWARRYQALEECVAALRCLWTEPESEYHGRYFDFDPVWSLPKPLRDPLPVYCGMGGKLGTRHAVRWADAWMPMDVALGSIAKGQIERKIGLFRAASTDAGRASIPITMVAFGDPTAETLHHYAELGVDRTIIGASRRGWDDPTMTMSFIDRYAELVPELVAIP
jgi:probable F420-dependent oxidoreductase